MARLVLQEGLPPSQIHIEGYVEYRPAATNETQEGRAKNRRVEILYSRDNVISQLIEQKKRDNENKALEATQPLLDPLAPPEDAPIQEPSQAEPP